MALVFEKLDSLIIVSLFRKLHHLFGTDYRFELYHGVGGGIKMLRYSKSDTKLLQFNLPCWPDTHVDTLFNWDVQRDYCPIVTQSTEMKLLFDVKWTALEQATVKNCLIECGGKLPAKKPTFDLRLRMLAKLHKQPSRIDEKTNDAIYDCKTHNIIVRMMTNQKKDALTLAYIAKPTYLILFNVGEFLSNGKTIPASMDAWSLLLRTNTLSRKIDLCIRERPHNRLIILQLFFDNFVIA